MLKRGHITFDIQPSVGQIWHSRIWLAGTVALVWEM